MTHNYHIGFKLKEIYLLMRKTRFDLWIDIKIIAMIQVLQNMITSQIQNLIFLKYLKKLWPCKYRHLEFYCIWFFVMSRPHQIFHDFFFVVTWIYYYFCDRDKNDKLSLSFANHLVLKTHFKNNSNHHF